jgi:hypothetical protein
MLIGKARNIIKEHNQMNINSPGVGADKYRLLFVSHVAPRNMSFYVHQRTEEHKSLTFVREPRNITDVH